MTPLEFQKSMSSKGFNCSQIVFSYFAPRLGLDLNKALKISSGFGKGMQKSSICGVVTGAYMVLGLYYGNSLEDFDKTQLKKKLLEFDDEFAKISNSQICKEIVGVDLRDIDKVKEMAIKNPDFMIKCSDLVIDTIKIIEKIVKES
ncbi:C-GCAxxG-C-C family protein [Lagierella sp.]|uniref:C-GCAxxG-C-C family protein n=1 Tax=Lagierella sp. TaxID=2849657 RepID=UPI002635CD3B|nr:C-GCAxxG-C-C family protein [Lagierella sp.]